MFYDLLIFIFMSYIKPQLSAEPSALLVVVYRTIPTSNHNILAIILISRSLYIVLFLHQTTTVFASIPLCSSCISYYSYIKPQLNNKQSAESEVVYRTIPTSNHNQK